MQTGYDSFRIGDLMHFPAAKHASSGLFRGHLMADINQALCDGKTELMVAPGGLMQPLDVVQNKPFKS